jgi:hypothetical protein
MIGLSSRWNEHLSIEMAFRSTLRWFDLLRGSIEYTQDELTSVQDRTIEQVRRDRSRKLLEAKVNFHS